MLELIFQLQREYQALKDSLSAAEAELAVFRKYNVYQHAKVYKIVNTVDKKVYIGCTTLPLVERFAIHRKKTGTGTMKIHQHMKKHGRDKFSIHLVKEVPTYSRWHLETEEYNVQITIPEEHGGAGMDTVAAVIVHHELSKYDPGFCLAYLAHSMLFVNNFFHCANEAMPRRFA